MRSSRASGGDGLANHREDLGPYIEGEISTVPGLSLEALITQTNSTVVAQLANYTTYTLTGATCKGGFEANTREGH